MATALDRVGTGCTIAWDSTGGTSYVVLASVMDGGKNEAKASTVKTSLLSQVYDTFIKTTIDPGEFMFTIIYDPNGSEYQDLAASFGQLNCPAPSWELFFPDNICDGGGSGSGSSTEHFSGHIVGLSREIKKESRLSCDITIKLTGNPGFHA